MKKYLSFFFVCLLTFSLALTTTPTFAKFFGSSQGILFGSLFSDFQIIATEFIADENKTESDHLWGAGDDLSKLPKNGEYGMDELEKVQFSVYNSTDKLLLVVFVCSFYSAPYEVATISHFEVSCVNEDGKIDESIMTSKVTTATFPYSGNEIVEPFSAGYYGDENMRLTGKKLRADYLLSFVLGDYRQHELTIIPTTYYSNAPVGDEATERRLIETYYVLEPDERRKYNISADFDSDTWLLDGAPYSTYSSITMKVIDYTGYNGVISIENI